MNEASNTHVSKSKTSKLAIASFLIPSILFIGSWCFILVLQSSHGSSDFMVYLFPFPLLGFYLAPISFILSILALIKIKRSRGFFRGYVLATLGILMSLLAFSAVTQALSSQRPEGVITFYQTEIMKLHKVIMAYSNTHNNEYPTATKWCDLLVEHSNIDETLLRISEKRRYAFPYAINPNAEPNSAPNVVLLFETKGGWNQFGGPELMSFENHYREGCNVLFNDGHVEFIKPKQKDNLKWK